MNIVYLVQDGNTNKFKVGFASNWEQRRKHYITHNPNIKFIECIKTRAASKHKIERMCQKEIEKMGGTFITNYGVKTEWFKFKGDFSLSMLKCCKNRKIYDLN